MPEIPTPPEVRTVIAYLDNMIRGQCHIGVQPNLDVTYIPSGKNAQPTFNFTFDTAADDRSILQKLYKVFGKEAVVLPDIYTEGRKRTNFKLVGRPEILLRQIRENDPNNFPELKDTSPDRPSPHFR